jgi:hypothetical protein
MNIKKAYQEIVALLEANENKKIKTLLPQIIALCEAKNGGGSEIGKTFLKDDDGEVLAIYCYYFKKWMPLCDVEFGAKKSTATGFNTMCKEGVSNWTKQQRAATKAKESLLDQLINEDLNPTDLLPAQAEIEEARKAIALSEEPQFHFDTAEKVLAYIDSEAKDADEVNAEQEDFDAIAELES